MFNNCISDKVVKSPEHSGVSLTCKSPVGKGSIGFDSSSGVFSVSPVKTGAFDNVLPNYTDFSYSNSPPTGVRHSPVQSGVSFFPVHVDSDAFCSNNEVIDNTIIDDDDYFYQKTFCETDHVNKCLTCMTDNCNCMYSWFTKSAGPTFFSIPRFK